MRKIHCMAALLLVAIGLASCKVSIDRDSDKKNVVSKTLQVGGFDRLSLYGHGDVVLVQDSVASVTVEAEEDKIDRIQWENKDGCLSFWYHVSSPEDSRKIVLFDKLSSYCIRISAPDIENIHLSGSGDIKMGDFTVSHPVGLLLEGSGDIETGVIAAPEITASVAGSGDIDMKARGAGAVSLWLSVAGSGGIEAALAGCGGVDASVAGSGSICLKGSARSLAKSVAGSGSIDDKELIIKE